MRRVRSFLIHARYLTRIIEGECYESASDPEAVSILSSTTEGGGFQYITTITIITTNTTRCCGICHCDCLYSGITLSNDFLVIDWSNFRLVVTGTNWTIYRYVCMYHDAVRNTEINSDW